MADPTKGDPLGRLVDCGQRGGLGCGDITTPGHHFIWNHCRVDNRDCSWIVVAHSKTGCAPGKTLVGVIDEISTIRQEWVERL